MAEARAPVSWKFWACVVTLLASWAHATPAHAQPASEPWVPRVVLWLPGESELRSRIRGQLSDIDVDIVPHQAPVPRDLTKQVEAAATLGRDEQANAVIWLAVDVQTPPEAVGDDRSGAYLFTWFAEDSTVTGRYLAARWKPTEPEQRSAQLEIAALAARSTVRSLRPPPPEPHETDSANSPPNRDQLRWIVGANGSMQADVPSTALWWGGAASVGVRWRAWTVAVRAGGTAPATTTDGGTDLTSSPNPVDLEASHRLPLTSFLWVEPLVRAGTWWIFSHTTPPSAAAPDRGTRLDARFAVGAGARLDWNVVADHFLHMGFVGSWMVDPPTYDIPRGASDNTSPYTIAPLYGILELGWRWVL